MKRILACILCLCLAVTLLSAAAEEPTVTGKVTEIEKYGHALLDVTIEDFEALGFELGDIVTVKAGTYEGDMPFFNGYYVDKGAYMVRAYPGHTNIAVCINYGKFNEEAGVDVGDEVTITLKEKAGALTVQEINNLVYTDDIADYANDPAVFANFRAVVLGDIAEGRLYRSCSPVDNGRGRAAYADTLIAEAGVKTVMNMANTEEEILAAFESADFASPFYKGLYEAGSVTPLAMPVNYSSDEFAEGIVKGMIFLSEGEAPFLVHCTEGKDRAGFASMLLEMLMGADAEAVVKDYMLSYVNYYGIEEGTEKYDMIAQKNVMDMMRTVCGLEAGASLEGADLSAGAQAYLTGHGMSAEAVQTLMEKLK